MKKKFVTLFAFLSLLCSLRVSAQSLVFHLIDGSTAEVELSSVFRMSTVGSKTIVSLPDGSTKEFSQNDILTVTYRETRGDVNRDNAVDVADIATIISIMAGQEPVKTISVTTGSVKNITSNSAVVEGSIKNIDSQVTVGVLYGISSTLSVTSDKKVTTTSKGDFTVTLSNLTAGTTYYYCSFAEVEGEYYYGETKSFMTGSPAFSVTVTTNEATDIETTSAVLNSSFELENITNSYTVGFFVTTSGTPSSSNYTNKYFYEINEICYGISQEVSELSPNTTYYYCAFILYDGVYYYGETKSFKTKNKGGYTSCPDSNHPHMIDLGLPSGTLWACCNVGASMPAEYGGLYAWGETQTKSDYTWDTYKYGWYYPGDFSHLVDIGNDIAGTSYDVATAKWGEPWRMPSLEQIEELVENCVVEYTTQSGISGKKFIGENGGAIFMPFAGYREKKGHFQYGTWGFYWSSTQDSENPANAMWLSVTKSMEYSSSATRYEGHSVRPVR